MKLLQAIHRRLDLRADILARAGDRRDTQRGVERICERARIGEPFERRAREAAMEHAHDRARQRGLRRRTGHDRLRDLLRSIAAERALPGDELVRDHPEREHVGGSGGRFVRDLLGCEVLDTMLEARDIDRALRQAGGEDSEVGDLHVTVGVDDHVRRRETEVGEATAVRVPDGAGGLRDERQCATRCEREPGEPCFCGEARRIETGDVLDGGERLALRDTELAHACDPRMLEAAVRARGGGQPLRECVRDRQLGMEALDRELPLEACDTEDFRARDGATRTRADRLEQLVATHALATWRGGLLHRKLNVYEDRSMTRCVDGIDRLRQSNLPSTANAGTTQSHGEA